jgi:hypothetical protein
MNKYEGYWNNKKNNYPDYPMPLRDVLDPEEANIVYGLILEKEKLAKKEQYKGYAESRIDGSQLGDSEFKLDDWTWPDSFANHYVKRYGVRPSTEFLKFIGYLK